MKEEMSGARTSKLSFLDHFIFSELLSTVTIRFLILGIGFATTTLITRSLSVADRGKYAVLTNLLLLFMTISSCGFHTSIVYFSSKNNFLFSSMYGASFVLSLLSIFIISFFYFCGILNLFFPTFNVYDFLIVFVGGPIVLFSYFNSNFFLGKNNFYWFNLLESIKLFLFFSFVLFIKFYMSFTYKECAVLFIISNALYSTFSFLYFFKNKFFLFSEINIKNYIEVFKYSFNCSAISYASCILAFLLSKYILFLINSLLDIKGLEEGILGYYAVASTSMDIISVFPTTLAFVIFPKISIRHQLEEKIKIVKNVIVVCLFFFLFVLILSFTVADYFFVFLYGSSYQASVPLFQLLLPTALCLSIISCISSFIGGIGMEKIAIYAPLWGLIFMILSSFILFYLKLLNIYNFIYTQNLSYIIYLILYLRFFIKKWKEI